MDLHLRDAEGRRVHDDLGAVSLRLLENLDDACELRRWLGERREVLGVDTETGGFDWWRDALRTVQLGDTQTGWCVPADWLGLIKELLAAYDGPIVMHNMKFDLHFLETNGVTVDRRQIHDTRTMAHLLDPAHSTALKNLSARFIHPRAAAGELALKDGFRTYGWSWATVPVDFPPYFSYAALDPVLTARLYERFKPHVDARFRPLYETEIACTLTLADMERRGIRLDHSYIDDMSRRLEIYVAEMRDWIALEFGVANPASNAQVINRLQEAGVRLFIRTEKGNLSLAAEVLKTIDHPLAAAILAYRAAHQVLETYLHNYRELAHGDLLHASINPLGARTGRMCLPDSHRLLTDRGALKIDDVEVGDRTLDLNGNWTDVTAVHRYAAQPVRHLAHEHRSYVLEATEDHRWVCARETRPEDWSVEPIKTGDRRRVRLAPAATFDFTSRDPVYAENSVAAFIGWLVSDGSCKVYDGGLRAHLYQTEAKFYEAMLRTVPDEAVMYDQIVGSNPHAVRSRCHTVRLKARWLRPLLSEIGLRADDPRTDPNLVRWVASLSLDDCRAFLQAVWFADGATAHPQNRVIGCDSEPLRDALQLAGYRCGYVSEVITQGLGAWSTKDRVAVRFSPAITTTRRMSVSSYVSDVWCVETASGTFTAWGSFGPYLTGNSVSRPSLQNIPRSEHPRNAFIARLGRRLVLADYDQIEMRLLAHFAREERMIEAIRYGDAMTAAGHSGYDVHSMNARAIYGLGYDTPVPREQRQITKNCVPLDTEILTHRGWLTHDAVEVGDLTLTHAGWQPVLEVIHHDDAELVRVGNTEWEAVVTPDHKWLAERRVRRKTDGRSTHVGYAPEWAVTGALHPEQRLVLAPPPAPPVDPIDVSPREAALIAWVVCDGSIWWSQRSSRTSAAGGARRGVQARIFQSKPEGIDAIEALLRPAEVASVTVRPPRGGDWPGRTRDSLPCTTWSLRSGWTRELWRRAGLEHGTLETLVRRLTPAARDAFIDACLTAEGDLMTRQTFSQNEGDVLDAVRLAWYLSGRLVKGTSRTNPNARHWMITARGSTVTTQRLRVESVGRAPVWCVRTPVGTWTMRQGHRTSLTGNSGFAKIYGAGTETFAATAGITLAEAEAFLQTYDRSYPGVARFQGEVARVAMQRAVREDEPYVVTPAGRRHPTTRNKIFKLVNYLVQGTAADVLKRKIVEIDHAGLGEYLLLPVHDELIADVPEDEVEEYRRELQRVMEDHESFAVPLTVDTEVVDCWGAKYRTA